MFGVYNYTINYKQVKLIVFDANNVILTLHGHYHRFEEGYLWNTEVQYKIQGNISKNELYKIDVKDGRVNKVELIEF